MNAHITIVGTREIRSIGDIRVVMAVSVRALHTPC